MSNPLYESVWKKIRENNNFIAAIIGPTGCGKSLCALRLAYDLDINQKTKDKRFPIDSSRVVFNVKDFYKLIDLRVKGKIPEGSVVVLDEAAIDLGNEKHYTNETLVNMKKILQTFRLYRLIVIMTFPGSIGNLAKPVRNMFDCVFDGRGINFKEGYSTFVPHWIQVNSYSGKDYRHSPTGEVNGKEVVMSSLKVRKPPVDLLNSYEKKKEDFANKLLRDTIKSEELREKEMMLKSKGPEYFYDKIKEDPEAYLNKSMTSFDWFIIKFRCKTTEANAKAIAATLNNDWSRGKISVKH